MRRLALIQTLSKKQIDKKLHIIEDITKEIKKTKEFNNFLVKNNLENSIIISDPNTFKNINRSAKNIKNIKVINNVGTNVYDIFKYQNLILTTSSIKKLQERILNEKN